MATILYWKRCKEWVCSSTFCEECKSKQNPGMLQEMTENRNARYENGRKPYVITQSRHCDRVVLTGTSMVPYAIAENTASTWTWKPVCPCLEWLGEHIGFVYISLCFPLTVPGTWHFPTWCISVSFVLQCQVTLSGWQVGHVSERVSLTIWITLFLCLLHWIPGQLCARLMPPRSQWSKLGLVEWTGLSGESGKF